MKYILTALLLSVTIPSAPAVASVEWSVRRELNLQATPLDMASSPDGKLVYVLVTGRILIYSVAENKILNSMPIEKSADRLVSVKDDSFVVSIATEKKLKVYQLEAREKIDISDLPCIGSKDAPVTIVVFTDYQCPYCGRLDSVIKQVLDKNKKSVKMVAKNFPLKFHAYAKKAATGALAASYQGKFSDFHEKLFANIATLNDGKVQEIAKQLNLDMESFNKKLQDPIVQIIINRDIADGERIGINGTPTVYVNGKLLKDRSLDGFQEMIDLELGKVR